MPHRGCRFTHPDLDRVIQATFVERLEFQRKTCSTNDRAASLACQPFHLLQMLGASQAGAPATAGALCSLIKTQARRLSPARLTPAISTAGRAVYGAAPQLIDHGPEPVHLAGANHVYLERQQVCGILVEPSLDQAGLMVFGIGIYVNNTLRNSPPDLQSSATALYDEARRPFVLIEVLKYVLARLAELLRRIGHRDEGWCARWHERCLLTIVKSTLILAHDASTAGRQDGDERYLVAEMQTGGQRCLAAARTQF